MQGERRPFSYAIIRVVPRIERGECFNAGVVLYCRQCGDFLAVRAELDERRLSALAPGLPADGLRAHLEGLVHVAAGDPAAGPLS
jgi:hypothetical protein